QVSELPPSPDRFHAVAVPLKVICSRRNRARLPMTAPVRRWHSRQWQIQMRDGSPSTVRWSCPQEQAARRLSGMDVSPSAVLGFERAKWIGPRIVPQDHEPQAVEIVHPATLVAVAQRSRHPKMLQADGRPIIMRKKVNFNARGASWHRVVGLIPAPGKNNAARWDDFYKSAKNHTPAVGTDLENPSWSRVDFNRHAHPEQ